MSVGYLKTKKKTECCGCEACSQICPKKAITMVEDEEGFRYPLINEDNCVHCNLCHHVCQYETQPSFFTDKQLAFGGYSKNSFIRSESTSGGAFSEIVINYCKTLTTEYVIFGAVADGIKVYHTFVTDINKIGIFRKSKYSQSLIETSYYDCKKFLLEGKNVIFSGTPCQISGLRVYLGELAKKNLLTIEVICEGVPSPLYIRKMEAYLQKEYGSSIKFLDYRCKKTKNCNHSLENFISRKWDFEVMLTTLQNNKRINIDRWFNPFWSIWLNHLMSRPSCYECKYTTNKRNADITLGDLWGVHIYCPELYGKNGGSSLIICNTNNGKKALVATKNSLYGHELDLNTVIKYQGPMRQSISINQQRSSFMVDLQSQIEFKEINKKWAKKPSLKLLWQKYFWGNTQKVALWNLKQKMKSLLNK